MSTLPLPAVGGLGWKTSIALTADGLLAVVFLGQQGKGGIVNTPTKSQYEMQSRFLLDVVV